MMQQQIKSPGRWCPTAFHKSDKIKVKACFTCCITDPDKETKTTCLLTTQQNVNNEHRGNTAGGEEEWLSEIRLSDAGCVFNPHKRSEVRPSLLTVRVFLYPSSCSNKQISHEKHKPRPPKIMTTGCLSFYQHCFVFPLASTGSLEGCRPWIKPCMKASPRGKHRNCINEWPAGLKMWAGAGIFAVQKWVKASDLTVYNLTKILSTLTSAPLTDRFLSFIIPAEVTRQVLVSSNSWRGTEGHVTAAGGQSAATELSAFLNICWLFDIG